MIRPELREQFGEQISMTMARGDLAFFSEYCFEHLPDHVWKGLSP